MINRFKKYWEILVILLLGLTPLLWYKASNSLALGHDMGYPINPIAFFSDRLFLWTDRVALGFDQTVSTAAILIHGLEAFISSLGFSIFTTQKIVFIFWFVLPGLAMYYFVSTIHKDKSQWFIRLSASLFYMFNHFLLQGWFIAERTKISLVVALPLLLVFTISTIEKKNSMLKGLALIFLTMFFLNGGGGLPLYGGIVLALFSVLIFFGLAEVRLNGKREIKRIVLLGVGIVGCFILANFYWILPTGVNILSSYKQNLSSIGGISGIISWSSEISKYASYLNLFRLQGIPDWYGNTIHPYANIFLSNPILILVSFLIPVLVFSSLFIVKRYPKYQKNVLFLSFLTLISIVFSAGSHPPFGFVYNSFLAFIPGFAIFRSPFYKFAPALWFSYSYLFSFSIYFLIINLKKPKFILSKYVKNVGFVLILVSILAYSFPFFTGVFFNWQKPFSTMIKLPAYVLEFDKWVNKNISYNDRIITFPELNQDWHVAVYNWNYWSTAPLVSLFTENSIITNDKNISANELLFVNNFYDSLKKGTTAWKRISQLLGINYFLLQNDFAFNSGQFSTTNPSLYKGIFSNLSVIVKKQNFGQWSLYKVAGSNPQKLSLSSNTSLVLTKKDLTDPLFDINSILSLPNSDNENLYFSKSAEKKNIPTTDFTRTILIESCLYCDGKEREINLYIPTPQILPGSIFYQFVKSKELKEEKLVADDSSQLVDFYLGISLKRIGELKQLIQTGDNGDNIAYAISEIKKDAKKTVDLLSVLDKSQPANQLEILRVDNFLKVENRSLNDIDQQFSGTFRQQITLLRDYIAASYQKNSVYEFIYPPDNEKHYSFTMDTGGNYEIFLQKQDFGRDLSFQKIIIDGQGVAVKPVVKNDYYLSLGKIPFSAGTHNLQFQIDQPDNLLKQVGDFQLAPNNPACKLFTLGNIYPNHRYVLNFNYLTEGGGRFSGPELTVGQFRGDTEVLPLKVQLSASNVSQVYETDIITGDNANKLKISLCHSPGYEDGSTISISNLNLEPVSILSVAAILDNTSEKNTPPYSITRINQTKYKVSVRGAKNPYLLVLDSEFNSNWKVSFDDSKKSLFGKLFGSYISENNHIVINGFSNGWFIDRQGDYSLTIEYAPQKYFNLGWIITIMSILAVFFYLIFIKYYGRKN